MKNEFEPTLKKMFFLAESNLAVQWNETYRIQERLMEGKNFMPESFVLTQLKGSHTDFANMSEQLLFQIGLPERFSSDSENPHFNFSGMKEGIIKLEDEDEEDWDEEDDEEWDEDEDDEEWDEDEDWDEDEEWDEDEDEDEEEEDWEDEEE